MIKIVIADDHKVFRQGIESLLAEQKDFSTIGDAGNNEELLSFLKKEIPHVILMDIGMGDTSGIALTHHLSQAYPSIKVLAFSMHSEKHYVIKMLEAGATGYLLKNAGKEEMYTTVHLL